MSLEFLTHAVQDNLPYESNLINVTIWIVIAYEIKTYFN